MKKLLIVATLSIAVAAVIKRVAEILNSIEVINVSMQGIDESLRMNRPITITDDHISYLRRS